MRSALVASVLLVTCAVAATTTVLYAADEGTAFRSSLMRALLAHDVATVQSMVAFPLKVTLPGGQALTLGERAALSGAGYTAIWTPDTICAIERGPLADDGQAVTIGGNVLVARRAAGGTLKISELRVIGAPAPPRQDVRAALDLRFAGAARQVAGNLAHNEVDRYAVSLTAGRVLQARLERFKGLDAVLRLVDARGKAVNPRADGKRLWSGSIPSSGDYRLEVVRNASYCDPPLTYLLTASVR